MLSIVPLPCPPHQIRPLSREQWQKCCSFGAGKRGPLIALLPDRMQWISVKPQCGIKLTQWHCSQAPATQTPLPENLKKHAGLATSDAVTERRDCSIWVNLFCPMNVVKNSRLEFNIWNRIIVIVNMVKVVDGGRWAAGRSVSQTAAEQQGLRLHQKHQRKRKKKIKIKKISIEEVQQYKLCCTC